ncbi:MAG TPA: response regulator [Ktedonobacterales bacterium]|nr:response regulator [Ktedonobacterales bacterium]
MRKTGSGRGAYQLPARRTARERTARASALTPFAPRPLGAPATDESARNPHGALLALPARQSWPPTELDLVASMAPPLVAGTLALRDAPAIEREPAPRVAPTRRHILIVEDDPRTAGVLRNALELEGEPDWGIELAGEGLCALESALRTPPDVVLLDVRLPGLDGAEVYRRLRASQPCGHTKVLFLSAGTSLDLHQRGIDDGVLLRKPFAVSALMTLIRALLAE